MAVTIKGYDHNAYRILSGLDSPTDTYKVILLSSSSSHNAADTTLAEVTNNGAWEVYGNGWSASGVPLSNITTNIISTNAAKLDADDVSVFITSGTLTFRHYAIYNATDTNGPPLLFVERDSDIVFAEDSYGALAWPTDGLINLVRI